MGLFNITRVEALEQSNGTSYLSQLEGGINTFTVRLRFVAIYPYNEDIDFIVKIYGEPLAEFPSHDFILGEQTPNSLLIHT